MTLFNIDVEAKTDPKINDGEHPEGCKGVYYRCRVESFLGVTKEEINTRIRLSKLKRMSCPGCAVCEYEEEYLREEVNICGNEEFLNGMEHNAIYKLEIESSKDWETGMYEVDGIDFVKVSKE